MHWHAAGFSDPFPVRLVTLDNPAYRIWGISLMEGKLDWVLLRRLRAQATAVGNQVSRVRGCAQTQAVTVATAAQRCKQEMRAQDFAISDHAWLSARVTYE